MLSGPLLRCPGSHCPRAHNSDLTIAKLHVDAAKSLLRQAKGEQLPSLGVVAEGGTARFKNSEAEADSESKFRVGAEASWEVDIFGKQVEKLTSVLESTEHRMHYSGDVNYLQVLLARQSLLHARLSLLSHRYGLLECSIQLYKALGGKF